MKTRFRLTHFFFRFAEALFRLIDSEEKRWGEVWRKEPKEGQEDRIYSRFEQYWVEFSREGMPIPWLRVAALAFVAWVRDNYPEAARGTYVDPD